METGRLRTIELPDRASALLESFVWSRRTIPGTADRINSIPELTPALQKLAKDGEAGENVWSAWGVGLKIWFFLAITSLTLARERRRPVLHISVYDENGEMTESGTYVESLNAGWQQCA